MKMVKNEYRFIQIQIYGLWTRVKKATADKDVDLCLCIDVFWG